MQSLRSLHLNLNTAPNVAALLYGIIAFAIQVLYAPFITFFVDFSSRHLNISWVEFVAAQVVYGIWNSTNEFFFGFQTDMEDEKQQQQQQQQSSSSSSTSSTTEKETSATSSSCPRVRSAERRLKRIQDWGLAWAGAFCVLWLPLSEIFDRFLPFHVPSVILYTAVLLLYGGCFAYVTVQHRALLVDIALHEAERQQCTLWSSLLGGIGSLSVVAASAAYSTLSYDTTGTTPQNQDQVDDNQRSRLRWVGTIVITACIAAILFHNIVGVLANEWKKLKQQEEEQQQRGEAAAAAVGDSEKQDDAPRTPAKPAAAAVVIDSEEADSEIKPLSPLGKPPSSNTAMAVDSPTSKDEAVASSNKPTTTTSTTTIWTRLREISASPPMRTVYIVWLLQELCCYVLTTFLISAVTEIVVWVRKLQAVNKESHNNHHHHHGNHHHTGTFFWFDCCLSGDTWITVSIAVSFVIPQVVLIGLLPLVRKHGLDYVVTQLFRSRVMIGVVAVWCFCAAPAYVGPVSLIVMLLLLRLVTECVCRLQPLILAALCDEHSAEWTASMMGAASLGSKPSQSIAPVLGYALLREISEQEKQQQQHHGGGAAVFEPERALYLYGILVGVAAVPTALVSLIAWGIWPLPGLGAKSKSQIV